MAKISAVILAKNEEKNIRHCLESIRWCDEIIVVDMESDDRTADIAKEFTDKVFSHPHILAFDRAKGIGVQKSSGDWVLLVDADEMVPVSLSLSLRKISKCLNTDIVEIPFRHYIMGACVENSGWGYTPLPRFFRKGKIEFRETIHDYMHPDPKSLVLRLESVDENCIVHFNYVDSTHFVEKLNRYTGTEAQHLYDDKVKFSYRTLFAESLREFVWRYFSQKGYKEGPRGFSLCLMMAFYRALTYIKLWEIYEYSDNPVEDRYERIRERLRAEWKRN